MVTVRTFTSVVVHLGVLSSMVHDVMGFVQSLWIVLRVRHGGHGASCSVVCGGGGVGVSGWVDGLVHACVRVCVRECVPYYQGVCSFLLAASVVS